MIAPKTSAATASARPSALAALQAAAFETLENRRLMTATLDDGVLSVLGTEANDRVAFEVAGNKLTVIERDGSTNFDADAVRRVVVEGRGGDDVLDLRNAPAVPVRIAGGAGEDYIAVGRGPGDVYGGKGDDTIVGGRGADQLRGGEGDDFVAGKGGDDRVWGNAGDDTLLGGTGRDLIRGEEGADLAFGGDGRDTLLGHEGNDRLVGGEDGDVVNGHDGDDLLWGQDGNDAMSAGDGADGLDGGRDRTLLFGSAGPDQFVRRGSDSVVADFNAREDEMVARLRVAAPNEPAIPGVPADRGNSDGGGDRSGKTGGGDAGGTDAGTDTGDGTGDGTGGSDGGGGEGGGEGGPEGVVVGAGGDGGGDGAGDAAPAVGPGVTLKPGTGFDGPRPESVRYGTGRYSDAQAVARWDSVEHQMFDGRIRVGVAAFHGAGIDRVEFSVEGGEWAAVAEMAENPDTNVVGYYVTLDADDFADGEIELRAVAFPVEGETRVLEKFNLNANAGRSLTGRTVYAVPGDDLMERVTAAGDGGRVLLAAGTYERFSHSKWNDPARNFKQYTTIESAPGVGRDEVVIRGGFRPYLKRMHVKDLTLDASERGAYHSENHGALWLDGVRLTHMDDGAWARHNTRFMNSGGFEGMQKFATDVYVHAMPNALIDFDFVRDSHVEDVSSDVFQNSRAVFNSTVGSYQRRDPVHHPDVLQYFGGNLDNILVYGVQTVGVEAQGIFIQYAGDGVGEMGPDDASMRNSAFVDITLRHTPTSGYKSQLSGRLEHVIFKDVDFGRQSFLLRNDFTPEQQDRFGKNQFIADDVVFDGLTVNQATYNRLTNNLPEGIELIDLNLGNSN